MKYYTSHSPWKLIKMWKKWMFVKASEMESTFFLKRRKGAKSLVLNISLADLSKRQYSFEILQISFTGKNWMFQKKFAIRSANLFFEMKERVKVFCVEMLMFWYITRRSVFIWNNAHLISCEDYLSSSKKWMFLKTCAMENTKFSLEWRSIVRCFL